MARQGGMSDEDIKSMQELISNPARMQEELAKMADLYKEISNMSESDLTAALPRKKSKKSAAKKGAKKAAEESQFSPDEMMSLMRQMGGESVAPKKKRN